MNGWFAIGAALSFLIGLSHSWFGKAAIFIRRGA